LAHLGVVVVVVMAVVSCSWLRIATDPILDAMPKETISAHTQKQPV
jgi:hypothetical protein